MGLIYAQYIDSPDSEVNVYDSSYDSEFNGDTEVQKIDLDGYFWVSAGAETAIYSKSGLSYGGGLVFAYNRGVSIGLKTTYFFDFDNRVDVLELGFLLRFFFRGIHDNVGPYIQFSGGQALFFRRDNVTIPAKWGIFYGGANLGWRLFLGEKFFMEPYIRIGYPFIIGSGLSTGIRF